MPGVVFVVCVPTAKFEKAGQSFTNNDQLLPAQPPALVAPHVPANNLNINVPEGGNAVLRLEVELRDKHVPQNRRGNKSKAAAIPPIGVVQGSALMVPMEKILDELLKKLEIEHAIWYSDKNGNYYQVIFPLQAGEPCETTLHCLTELGIGKKSNTSVSVLPCSASFDALTDNSNEHKISETAEAKTKWENFVESIKSKLTVKQVVDGVRAGGSLSFDYLLLIVTADSLAALGLIENNASNIVAAMLVSPLMGPVMSITFGAIISDRELIKVGFISLLLGMFISILFGFIFGLILGTTEMPWGFGDFPTEEMKGRGNARSLWMGILWALTSGSGVAIALLQGSAGPLIGVAISASLLPPVVNCGMFWALGCIWLIYDGIKIPHLKGEAYTGNSSYVPVYTNYMPTEFFINGIVSGLLTVINVICIFITAIVVLKIKEVAAPYTSSPDLRRFWETDIRTVRKTNRSTIRRKNTTKDKIPLYEDLGTDPKSKNLGLALEQALKQAMNDETFRKVKRMSYSSNAASSLVDRLGLGREVAAPDSVAPSQRNSKSNEDYKVLEKLITNMLEQAGSGGGGEEARNSPKLSRFGSLSRSLRIGSFKKPSNSAMPTILESQNSGRRSWASDQSATGVKRVLNTIQNAPHRFSQSHQRDEETTNILD